MQTTETNDTPILAAPGAGLPWIELQVAKQIFRWQLRRSNRGSAAALIRSERAEILRLAKSCDENSCNQRVLIKRMTGMEDSSRHWSMFMTIDHLQIVNTLVAEAITLLGHGKIPEQEASTATVKPSANAGPSVFTLFEKSCEEILRAADAIQDLHTTTRYAHPWFGPLDAAAWHFMAGFHMRLHRAQIEAILRDLRLVSRN